MIPMQFGAAAPAAAKGMPQVIASGTLEGTESVTLDCFFPGGLYLSIVSSYTTATGEFLGCTSSIIAAPLEGAFGSAALSRGNAASFGSNSPTQTANNDSTLTIASTAAGRSAEYVIMRIL